MPLDMSNGESVLAKLLSRTLEEGLIRPDYDGYGLSNLASNMLAHFGAGGVGHNPTSDEAVRATLEGAEKLVLVLVDGLSCRHIAGGGGKGIVERYLRDSMRLTFLTSTFPSTRTTALTTLNTGLTPQEHAIIGYTMYLKKIGVVTNLVSFAPSAAPETDALVRAGLSPASFLDTRTIHDRLSAVGVKSYVATRRFYKETPLTVMLGSGALLETYTNSPDLFVRLRKIIRQERKPLLLFPYWDGLDTAGHVYGPWSEESSAELENIFFSLKTQLLDRLSPSEAHRTAIMVTGDHGQVDVPREKVVSALDHPKLMEALHIPPTGDSRASYLYVRPGLVDWVKDYFDKTFGDRFLVLDRQKAVGDGLFGRGGINPAFSDRVGDLLVIPRGDSAFFYPYKLKQKGFDLKGAHGGLSPDELIVPLLCIRAQ